MNPKALKLTKDEKVFLELKHLYEMAGYRRFRMRKFEEYSLYVENKNFLSSENVITFNDPQGKLLALKPDVTLSIVKNAKATKNCTEKVYYHESVYRLEKQNHEFKEIDQIGLEFIGDVDMVQTLEVCLLALKSLKAIDKNFIFAVSHMSFITGLLDSLDVESDLVKSQILNCIRSKNSHDLVQIAIDNNIDKSKMDRVAKIANSSTDFISALKSAKALAVNESMIKAVSELENLYSAVVGTEFEVNIRLDFSILNDIDYYNGIIFQGYVSKCPRILLSGGRYDRLLEKFNKKVGAMGFALALQDLNTYYNDKNQNTVDVALVYNEANSAEVLVKAEKLREQGKSVLITKEKPKNIKFSEMENLG